MLRTLFLMMLPGVALAVCPADEPVIGDLVCGDTVSGDFRADPHTLDWLYSCGDPYAGLEQAGPDHLYTYMCPEVGALTIVMTGATCDFDMYVLDDSCDPDTGCLAGNTDIVIDPVVLTVECGFAGEMLNIVLEAYDIGAGTCPDGRYTLQFDMESGVCDTGTGTGTGTSDPSSIVVGAPEPGIAGETNTFSATGADAGAEIYFIAGVRPGTREVPGCPGTDLGTSKPIILGITTADATGAASIDAAIPAVAEGREVKIYALDRAACDLSEEYMAMFL
jgi:hypothetical protein